VVYLRTTLASVASLFAFVLVFGFPASGQETTAAPEAQETATPTQPNGDIGFGSASEGGSGIFEMSPNGAGVTPVVATTTAVTLTGRPTVARSLS
jgi:hypothetical protein